MSRDHIAVVVGFVASVVLTPLVATLWQRLWPPRTQAGDMDAELVSRGDRLGRESIALTFGLLAILVYAVGFGRALDGWLVGVFFGGLIGIPTLWIGARVLSGYLTAAEFRRYFEHRHGISVGSAVAAGVGGLVVGVFSSAMLLY